MIQDHEAAVFRFVDENRQALLQLAIEMIATPSQNPPGNEIHVARVAEKWLRSRGFADVQIYEPKPQRANLVCRFDAGRPGRVLLLNGHLDTKPPHPLEAWKTDPYKAVVKDGKLYGLGAADMKGPNAALAVGLAAAVSAAGAGLCGSVLLVLSADEEGPFVDGARYLVQEVGLQADAGLIAEPVGVTRNWEALPLISRGLSCLRFTVEGTQTHSSLSDRLPVVNASLEASRLILFLEKNLRLTCPETHLCPSGPTVNLGATFNSGTAYAMVPGFAEFTADIRTLPGMTQEQLRVDIDRCVNEFRAARPGVQVSWDFFSDTRAWTEPLLIDSTEPLIQSVLQATQAVLGEAPPLGCFPGGTDALWWYGAGGIPTIPGFGPGLLSSCHQPNEYIEVEEIVRAAKIYALTIIHYLNQEA